MSSRFPSMMRSRNARNRGHCAVGSYSTGASFVRRSPRWCGRSSTVRRSIVPLRTFSKTGLRSSSSGRITMLSSDRARATSASSRARDSVLRAHFRNAPSCSRRRSRASPASGMRLAISARIRGRHINFQKGRGRGPTTVANPYARMRPSRLTRASCAPYRGVPCKKWEGWLGYAGYRLRRC
jgi:hypothetical protein